MAANTRDYLTALSLYVQSVFLVLITFKFLLGLFHTDSLYSLAILNFFVGCWQLGDALVGSLRGSTWRKYYLGAAVTYLLVIGCLLWGMDRLAIHGDLLEYLAMILVIGLPTAMAYAYAWLTWRAYLGDKILHNGQ